MPQQEFGDPKEIAETAIKNASGYRIKHLTSNDYVLNIVQQPAIARVAGPKEKERKPVDPQPFVRLTIDSKTLDPQKLWDVCPHFFMIASLWRCDCDQPVEGSQSHALGGTVVSSMHRLRDDKNQDGCFFVFPDLAVKREGTFRIKFTLFELRREVETKSFGANVKSIVSNPVQVFASKDFPGMSESTPLARTFADQGIKLRIRKENTKGHSRRLRYGRSDSRMPAGPMPGPIGYWSSASTTPMRQQVSNFVVPQSSYNSMNSGSGQIDGFGHAGTGPYSTGMSSSRTHNPSSYVNGGTGNTYDRHQYAGNGTSSMNTSNPRSQYTHGGQNAYTQTNYASSAQAPQGSQDLGITTSSRPQYNHEQVQSSDLNQYGQLGDPYNAYTQSNYETMPTTSNSRGFNLPPLNTTMLSQPSRSQMDLTRYSRSHSSTQRTAENWNDRLYDQHIPQASNPPILPSQTVSPPLSEGNPNPHGQHDQFSGTIG